MTPVEITGAITDIITDNKAVFLTVLGAVAGLGIGITLVKSGIGRVQKRLGKV